MFMSTPSARELTAQGSIATEMTIQVGGEATAAGGIFQFIPAQISNAPNGTVIAFDFSSAPSNHSVTQSSFANPCMPLAGGFDSGWVLIPEAGLGSPTFRVVITDDTKPIWFYCKQLTPSPHCIAGMVGAINAPTTGNTFEAFQASAEAFNGIPGQSQGGLAGVGASAVAVVGVSGGVTVFGMTQSGSRVTPSGVLSSSTFTSMVTSHPDNSGSTSSPIPNLPVSGSTAPISATSPPLMSGSRSPDADHPPGGSVPPGPIAGGVAGGVVLTGLLIFLVWFRKHKLKSTTEATDNNTTSSPSYAKPYTLQPITKRRGRLQEKLRREFSATETTSPLNVVTVAESMTVVTAKHSEDQGRVQQLRRERDRINQELAAMEQNSGPGSNISEVSRNDGRSMIHLRTNQQLLTEQMTVLQAQIRQLEERQHHRQSDLPPLYNSVPVHASRPD